MSSRGPSSATRRRFLATTGSWLLGSAAARALAYQEPKQPAQISITLDLEMSRHYPKRGMLEWDYQKGNLSEPTKQYSVEAGRIAREQDGLIHYFCVGRVLEQASVDWLKELIEQGHPVGNHTYDHVNVKAKTPEATQYRFRRCPWLVRGKTAKEVIRENILMASLAMKERLGIEPKGFRTPGGFRNGLEDRPDVQKMLLDLGFKWVSSKYPRHLSGRPREEPEPEVYESIVQAQANAQPFVYPTGLIEVPMSPVSDVAGFRSKFWKRKHFLKAVRLAVEWAIETGGVYDFLAHPSCLVVEDPDFEIIRLICRLVREAGDRAAIVDLDTVARRAKNSSETDR